MKRACVIGLLVLMVCSSVASAANRIWILPIDRRDEGGPTPWTEVSTGGYPGTHGGHYWWKSGTAGNISRAYWKFSGTFAPVDPAIGNTTEEPPDEPRLYWVETWVPPANSSVYSPIEVNTVWGIEPAVPWNGNAGVNRQWLVRNCSNQGTWVMAGLGPQAPVVNTGSTNSVCAAGANGRHMWLRRGDELYVKFDFGFTVTTGVSAIRLTEMNPYPTCGTATFGGPVDLRCLGNADPILGVGPSLGWDAYESEPFARASNGDVPQSKMLGDRCLAAVDWKRPCRTEAAIPADSGLPVDGEYVTHLPTGDVRFKLRYDGRNSLSWDAGATGGTFNRDNVYTLNGVAGREFVAGYYRKMYLLTAKSGGHNGQINVQLVYGDSTSETVSAPLYEWFNDSGDGTMSMAVGANGTLRSMGANGFKRVTNEGLVESGGGDTSGAFLFVHPIAINSSKILNTVNLTISADGRGFGGWIDVVGITMDSLLCNIPQVDSDGDGDVDAVDFAAFQACVNVGMDGVSRVPVTSQKCTCFDLSGPSGAPDNNVDVYDFVSFTHCATGSEIDWVWSAACPN